MHLAAQMDRIYRDLALADIPWNVESPPALLVQLVDSGWVSPGTAVDLGCGAGNYAVWLATRGFQVTGMDISPRAIALATELAASRGVQCRFVVADLRGESPAGAGRFDFAYDWEVLHHVFPEERERYVASVHRLLHPGGRYFSVCFSEAAAASFPGTGKMRTTRLGTRLYFSSAEELRQLFSPWFAIESLREVAIAAKVGSHQALAAWLVRRERGDAEERGG